MLNMLGGFREEAALLRGGQVGLEPTMVEPAGLQAADIAAKRLTHMAERTEFKADTLRVQLLFSASGISMAREYRFAIIIAARTDLDYFLIPVHPMVQ